MRLPILFCCICLLLFRCAEDGKSSEEELKLNPFPNTPYHKLVAYKMDGNNRDIVNKQNELSSTIVGEGVELTEEQGKRLLAIYSSTDTYGSDFYRCFEPHLGFVFYDIKGAIVAHSTVCFECNWMRTSPDIGAFIFSVKGARSLVNLEGDIFEL